MSDILSKISSYNIFNNLLPGTVFVFFCRTMNIYEFEVDSIVVELFLYYFVGMSIGRIGSVIIEPALMRLGVVTHGSYGEYLRAVQADPQVERLLEVNNTYRTVVAVFVCILIAAGGSVAVARLFVSEIVIVFVIVVLMIVLYTVAYRKQNIYIRKRVEHQKGNAA